MALNLDQQGSNHFGTYLDRTARSVKQAYLKVFQQLGVDITTEQWVLLMNLYEKDGQSQTELANDSFKNAPTVSRIIDLLVKKELVERRVDREDRRRFHIFLSPAGKETVEKVFPSVIALRKKGWNGLSSDDYQTFMRIMDQVFDNFAAEDATD